MKILQIIPADGWFARYYDEETGKNYLDHVTVWALVDDYEQERDIVGMSVDRTGRFENCSLPNNFLGYVRDPKIED